MSGPLSKRLEAEPAHVPTSFRDDLKESEKQLDYRQPGPLGT